MSRLLLASCLCFFATAALAVPPVDKCSKIATRTSPAVAPGRVAPALTATPAIAPVAAPAVATVSAPDTNNHHSGGAAASPPHVAQPRSVSPRWHSFLPGMFR